MPPEDEPAPRSIWLDPASPRMLKHAAAILLVSLAASGFAIAFRAAAAFVFKSAFHATDVVSAFQELPPLARPVLVALGGLLAGLVGVIAVRRHASQGFGGVMEAVALGRGTISLRASLWKALGCWLAIVTGSSIGREGPLIQFGGAMGSTIGAAGKMAPDRMRILIAAGTAAGFTAAYNTPFAAVLFVVEVVTGVVTLDVVLGAVLATAISTAVTRLAIGGGPIYGARGFIVSGFGELALFPLLGAVAGVVGTAFTALLAATERLAARLPVKQPFTAAIGAAIVGIGAIFLPEITGNGYEVINLVLDSALVAKTMAILLVGKMLATAISVGSGTPGGTFTPSLFLGAALGGLAGDLVAFVSPGHAHAPGAFALVGMAAVCAATTHAPLMAAVLVFELSGDYSIVLPLLLATGAATAVARRIRPTSIYMDELQRRGVAWRMTWSGREVHDHSAPS
jgi:CIC family chloride channel protein